MASASSAAFPPIEDQYGLESSHDKDIGMSLFPLCNIIDRNQKLLYMLLPNKTSC